MVVVAPTPPAAGVDGNASTDPTVKGRCDTAPPPSREGRRRSWVPSVVVCPMAPSAEVLDRTVLSRGFSRVPIGFSSSLNKPENKVLMRLKIAFLVEVLLPLASAPPPAVVERDVEMASALPNNTELHEAEREGESGFGGGSRETGGTEGIDAWRSLDTRSFCCSRGVSWRWENEAEERSGSGFSLLRWLSDMTTTYGE